jgi:hypothetical protein
LYFDEPRRKLFVEALRETGSIKKAAAEADVATGSVAWAREQSPSFGAEVAEVQAEWKAKKAAARPRPRGGDRAFTPDKRLRFIKALGKTGCISDAARVAGISRKTANYWRVKDAEFDRTCAAAIHMASSHIEILAWERAVTGIEEQVIHYGKVVGTRIKRSDAIFRMLLMASNGSKYGRLGAAGRQKRKEIEKELRPKIEHEVLQYVRASQPSIEEARDEVLRRIAKPYSTAPSR